MTSTHLPVVLPTSRGAAKAIGASRYFTGKPCANGHIELRTTCSGHCLQCDRDRIKERLKDPEYRKKHQALCWKSHKKRRADPEKLKRIRAREHELYHSNPERKQRRSVVDRLRNQNEANKEARRTRQRAVYHEQYKFDPVYKEKLRARGSQWAKDNNGRRNAITAYRRSLRKQASPKWLDSTMRGKIEVLYVIAQRLTSIRDERYEVDHIVPLNNESVCGLHVPWNLQVIPASENRSKSNNLNEAAHGYS